MSSLKRAFGKSQTRPHFERSQPQHRQQRGLGLLEKKSDYKKRAADYASKKRRLQRLAERAAMRNPEEFNIRMLDSRIVDGRHVQGVSSRREQRDSAKSAAARLAEQKLARAMLHNATLVSQRQQAVSRRLERLRVASAATPASADVGRDGFREAVRRAAIALNAPSSAKGGGAGGDAVIDDPALDDSDGGSGGGDDGARFDTEFADAFGADDDDDDDDAGGGAQSSAIVSKLMRQLEADSDEDEDVVSAKVSRRRRSAAAHGDVDDNEDGGASTTGRLQPSAHAKVAAAVAVAPRPQTSSFSASTAPTAAPATTSSRHTLFFNDAKERRRMIENPAEYLNTVPEMLSDPVTRLHVDQLSAAPLMKRAQLREVLREEERRAQETIEHELQLEQLRRLNDEIALQRLVSSGAIKAKGMQRVATTSDTGVPVYKVVKRQRAK